MDTDKAKFAAVDQYICEHLLPPDPVLEAALQSSHAAGLPPISVAPNQGKFLSLLARSCRAKRILEIGTLGGYSTIWLARALPLDGRLITLELDPKHAAVARENLDRAGFKETVEVRVGPALQSLEVLVASKAEPFDLIFIDADKSNIPAYVEWSLKLARVGSLIIADNVVRNGGIVDADSTDPSVRGVRVMYDLLAAHTRLDATAVQTVGSKGHDGFAMAIVIGD